MERQKLQGTPFLSLVWQSRTYWDVPFALLLFTASWFADMETAQGAYPACKPPKTGEYLVLVLTPTATDQADVKRTLPADVSATVCAYLKDVVTRIDGFTTVEVANKWAEYINRIAGLPAFVSRPADAPVRTVAPAPTRTIPSQPFKPVATPTVSRPVASTPPQQPKPTVPQNLSAYTPRSLGNGYAVLVDYRNRPEVAGKVRQLTGREVGLVTYGNRPYLLANYTTSQGTASATLKALSDRGYMALLVDGRQVILLRAVVSK